MSGWQDYTAADMPWTRKPEPDNWEPEPEVGLTGLACVSCGCVPDVWATETLCSRCIATRDSGGY